MMAGQASNRQPSRGAIAALVVLAVGALCMGLTPVLPWLTNWPAGRTLPMTEWIGDGMTWFLGVFKPLARGLS